MASFTQMFYCKNCKKNVSVDKNGQCASCGNASLKRSWSVRFLFVNENSKQVRKRLTGYSTKREAQDGYIAFINDIKTKKPIKQLDELTFLRLYEEYKTYTKSRIKDSSFYDFCSKCDLHILPYFKDFPVKDITPRDILKWQETIDKFSFKYKTGLRTYLHSILKYAEKYYDIPNQVTKVDNFRDLNIKKEMQVWTPEEFSVFISAVSNEIYKTFFFVLYYTGLRKGEALALTWKDVDLKNAQINVDKSLTRKVEGKTYEITTPKNKSSIRKVSIPQFLVEILRDYKKGRENDTFAFGGSSPLSNTNLARQIKIASKKAGVKEIRIHDFRHSHASFLLSQGASIVSVAKRLGHSNIEQTLNTYAHVMPKEEDFVLEILDKFQKSGLKLD